MLLGLILIYFVGKAFYDLAGQYNRSQWGFAILGVVSYYAGILVAGFVMGIVSELGIISFYDYSELVLGLMAFPVGVATCWGTYALLKNQWSKTKKVDSQEILDGDMLT